MPLQEHAIGFAEIVPALYHYLHEIEAQRSICERNLSTTAIHTKGRELQIYKQFKRSTRTAQQLRKATYSMDSWEKSMLWQADGENWEKLQQQIENRMQRHSRLHPILTKGISWDDRPILIHAYKFEPDAQMKVELVVPDISHHVAELPLTIVAHVLHCHECLIPECVAEARAPYERHETNFLTIKEYLVKTMPKNLCASQFLLDSS